jgi:hypothetical protein
MADGKRLILEYGLIVTSAVTTVFPAGGKAVAAAGACPRWTPRPPMT